MVLPYLKSVFVVWASLGLHLDEPFYARTIQEGATHSSLKEFYIYPSQATSLSTRSLCWMELGRTCFLLLRKTEFPILDQAENIYDTPVTNIGMERSCAKVDYRLQKLKCLEAVSRSIILQKTQDMRDDKPSNFRSFKDKLEKVKELKLFWSDRMKAAQEKGSDEKQEVAKKKEEKRLDTLDFLKSKGGPFTDEREVNDYLAMRDEQEKDKVKRMKLGDRRTL